MTNGGKNERVKRSSPFCQATGCFNHADVYVVLKETDVETEAGASNQGFEYDEIRQGQNDATEKQFEPETEFDGFKLILYLCYRHDNDFNYLIKGSELGVAKRCYLQPMAGLRRVQSSSR